MLTPLPAFYWIWSPALSILAEEGAHDCRSYHFTLPFPCSNCELLQGIFLPMPRRLVPVIHNAAHLDYGVPMLMVQRWGTDSGSLLRYHKIPICSQHQKVEWQEQLYHPKYFRMFLCANFCFCLLVLVWCSTIWLDIHLFHTFVFDTILYTVDVFKSMDSCDANYTISY